MWLEVQLPVSATPADFATRLESTIEAVQLISHEYVCDTLSGKTLQVLHDLRETAASVNSLLACVENESTRRFSIPLPLLRRRKTFEETAGFDVESSPCWRNGWPSWAVVVEWSPQAKSTEACLRVEYSNRSKLPEDESVSKIFEFPVEQWQHSSERVSKQTDFMDKGTTFFVQLPFNHVARQIIWRVLVDGVPTRVRRASLVGDDSVMFEHDEIELLRRMGEQGFHPKLPVYAYSFGEFGPNLSRLDDVRLVIEMNPVPPSSELVCDVHVGSENMLVVCGGYATVKFSG